MTTTFITTTTRRQPAGGDTNPPGPQTGQGSPTRWIGQRQATLSDYVHAGGDTRGSSRGWGITSSTGALGFGARSYHDPRFAARRTGMVGQGYPVPAARRPFSELARPARGLGQ